MRSLTSLQENRIYSLENFDHQCKKTFATISPKSGRYACRTEPTECAKSWLMQCNKTAHADGLASLLHDLVSPTELRDRQPRAVAVLRLRTKFEFGPGATATPHCKRWRGPFHRCMKPSVSVCMKLTSAFSSSSESPSRPMNLVFILSVDSGAGQHVVPSPGSSRLQRRRTSRVL
jgi:hypothetical protein